MNSRTSARTAPAGQADPEARPGKEGAAAAEGGHNPGAPAFPDAQAVHEGATQDEDAHSGHGHAEQEEGEEAEAGRDLAMSVEDILAATCEHGILTYRCDECRYEVGVVKVAPSLLGDSGGTENGLLKTVRVSQSEVDTVLNATGEIQLNGNAAAHIAPRISGVIKSMQVDIGTQVKKDQVLFEIESVELGRALSDFEKAKALTDLSLKNLEREKSLYGRKISSEKDVIEAQMSYEQNRTELQAAEQKLHVLGLRDSDFSAVPHNPQGILTGRLPVRAPLDGAIIEKHGVVGEVVDPGKDVLLLADLRTVWVWASIYEKDMGLLLGKKRKPLPVRVSVHSFPGRTFEGEVDYIGATMDEQTRTVKVRATVNNEQGLLRPGMFCEIQILGASGQETLAIPKVALLSDEGRDFVFKHLADDYYVRREVKKGQEFGDSVEVMAGVTARETIIADGAFLLKSDVLRSKMGAGCAD